MGARHRDRAIETYLVVIPRVDRFGVFRMRSRNLITARTSAASTSAAACARIQRPDPTLGRLARGRRCPRSICRRPRRRRGFRLSVETRAVGNVVAVFGERHRQGARGFERVVVCRRCVRRIAHRAQSLGAGFGFVHVIAFERALGTGVSTFEVKQDPCRLAGY